MTRRPPDDDTIHDDDNDDYEDNDDDNDDIADHDINTNSQVWDISNKKTPLLHTLDDHLGYVTCIQWIPGELFN